jgi:hypothetical protein
MVVEGRKMAERARFLLAEWRRRETRKLDGHFEGIYTLDPFWSIFPRFDLFSAPFICLVLGTNLIGLQKYSTNKIFRIYNNSSLGNISQ